MDLALNSNWDIYTGVNDLTLVEDAPAIDQNMRQRLSVFLGEYFLDDREGVPYFQQILVKAPDTQIVTSALARTILGTPGVLELLELSMDIDNATRILTVTFKAQTTEGVTDFTIQVP